MQEDDKGGVILIRKIILAVTFAGIFVLTFAIGVGFIIAGAGDFSWDIVSQYVSVRDIVKIHDKPISHLFSFSDHSEYVGSHAEGKIGCPTENGVIIFENILEDATITASSDQFIHLTVDGKIRLSSTVKSSKTLTGENIPDIQFEFNKSTDEAIIKIRKLRGKEIKIEIALPAEYGGNIRMKNIAGGVSMNVPLKLAGLEIKGAAGTVKMKSASAKKVDISDVAGDVSLSSGVFEQVNISDSMNDVSVSGTVGGFNVESVLGKIKIESDKGLQQNCSIKSVKGSVDVILPKGSKFKLEKKEVVGIVTPLNGDKKAEFTISVENIIGKVSIKKTGTK